MITFRVWLHLPCSLLLLQAVRNLDDLECMACPPKYRQMNTFYKYYTGEATAPVLTIFSRHSLLHLPCTQHSLVDPGSSFGLLNL